MKMWAHGLDILVGAIALRALLGWISTHPRVLYYFLPVGAVIGLVTALPYLGLPLVSALTLYVLLPATFLLLLSALPDLRFFFQKTDWRSLLFWGDTSKGGAIPDMASALWSLIKKRHGALLVFPNREDVEPLITGGEEYDAQFRKSLLVSLFNPEAPRHDGAVIFKGDRIVQVGAVLPLASAERALEDWGTRHLAGLGLSKQCDADVLVVSEERGTVTHVHEGVITVLPAGSEEQLQQALEGLWGAGEETGRLMRRVRLSAALWLLAFILAAAGSFRFEGVAQTPFTKPSLTTTEEAKINLINIPPGLFVDSLSEGKCQVLLQIPKETFVVGRLDLSVVLDLQKARVGTLRVPLTRELLKNFPTDGEVFRFQPDYITLQLAEIRQRELPVKARFNGLAPSLAVERAQVEPELRSVKIRDTKWKETQPLETMPVELSQVTKPGKYVMQSTVNLPGTITLAETPENLTTKVTLIVVKKNKLPVTP